jgi:hypothetical protein
MFRQDRTNPSTAVSNWRGRHDTPKAWPSTAVSSWLNGGLFGGAALTGAAYYAGGTYPRTTTIDKFLFVDDTRTTLGTGLSGDGRNQLAGAANSGTAAYFAGGNTGFASALVDKFAFADDSRTTLGTGLSAATYGLAGAANSGTAAYFAGGNA